MKGLFRNASLTRYPDTFLSSLDVSHSGLPSNPPTPPTKTSDALRLDLQVVNQQLDAMKLRWDNEKRQLLGEKAVLQDAANRMNMEVRSAKDEAKRATEAGRRSRVDTREIEKARAVIADLEAELQAERTRLRQMSTEQNRVQREKSGITRQLQRTEAVRSMTNFRSTFNLKVTRISMMSKNNCRKPSVKTMN